MERQGKGFGEGVHGGGGCCCMYCILNHKYCPKALKIDPDVPVMNYKIYLIDYSVCRIS